MRLLLRLGVVSAPFLVLLVLAADRLRGGVASYARSEAQTELASIALYWGFACVAVVLHAFWRRDRRYVALIAAGALLGLAILEVAARVIPIYPALRPLRGVFSPAYHHVYPPNILMYQGVFEGVRVLVSTNEDGMRSPYSRADFARHAPRVAALGDSLTFGFGVRGEAAWPARLEARLRERLGSGTAVLNAAMVSGSPLLARLRYEGIVAAYRPDLVLYLLDASDIGDDLQYAREARASDAGLVFESAGPRPRSLPVHVAVKQLASPLGPALLYPLRRLFVLPPERRYRYDDFGLRIGGQVENNRFFIYRHPLEQTRPYFEATLGHLRELGAAVRRSGARFAVFVAPRFHHWDPEECPDNWEWRYYRPNEPYQYEYLRYFESASERVGFPIRSLLPDFRAPHEAPLVFRSDPHWNERGHALVAAAVERHLLEDGLLGGPW